ncbi:MAG TPA: nucleotidyl transferase AbiEii/AbiGii toxin family protein [Kofleriaceae bacterium]|nr:nucleotidyl transferase AbiEii/AbiGii toxin family protein [Kofleriaceae bacterium]
MFIQQLVGALANANVAYCVVGGVAVNLHGVPRMTYDIDIMVATDRENLDRCHQLLSGLGLQIRLPIALVDAADRELAAQWEDERSLLAITYSDPRNPLREVDILIAPSLDPDGVVARAVTVGTGVRVAAVADLIALKRRANRSQDLSDIAHLERLTS